MLRPAVQRLTPVVIAETDQNFIAMMNRSFRLSGAHSENYPRFTRLDEFEQTRPLKKADFILFNDSYFAGSDNGSDKAIEELVAKVHAGSYKSKGIGSDTPVIILSSRSALCARASLDISLAAKPSVRKWQKLVRPFSEEQFTQMKQAAHNFFRMADAGGGDPDSDLEQRYGIRKDAIASMLPPGHAGQVAFRDMSLLHELSGRSDGRALLHDKVLYNYLSQCALGADITAVMDRQREVASLAAPT